MTIEDLANQYVSKADVLAQKGDCYDAKGHLLYAVGTGNILRLPVADVKPVVHGKWRNTGSGQECSICKEFQPGYDSGRFYCPNCGADMRSNE